MGFIDFAGSSIVHPGRRAGLVGAMLLDPVSANTNGRTQAIPGHNMAIATLALILWIGWYGFNPGSVLAMDSNGCLCV